MTSIAKMAAVSGVPNSAENTALIPHRVASGRSFSPSRSRRPASKPIPPPICSAAPSRPALPPPRWVSTVEIKMTGTSSTGTFLPKCTDSMTALVSLPSTLVTRYSPTIISPSAGSRYRIHGCAALIWVA